MKHVRMFFMAVAVAIHKITAALDFPHKVGDFITYANAIFESMNGSTYFTGLAAQLTDFKKAIDNLVTFETGMKSKPPTATSAQRDGALVIVQGFLRTLRNAVQDIADADIENAETIITAAGMHVKKIGTHDKPDFEVKQDVSGSVLLVAKGIEHNRGFHDWGMSTDGTNWTPVTPTVLATTKVSGFVPGSHWEFRHRAILVDGPQDWTQSDPMIVT